MRILTVVAVLACLGFSAGTAAGDPPPSAWEPVVSSTSGAIGDYYTVSQPANTTGVLALLPVSAIPEAGTGALVWNASNDTLSFRGGPAVTVNPAVSESYDLPEPSGGADLIAVVTRGKLPAVSTSDTLTVTSEVATAGLGNVDSDSVHNAAAFDGAIYIGLYNRGSGTGSVWRSADGVNWVKAASDSFGQGSCHVSETLGVCHVDSFGVFDGDLYAGTDTGQIWRTSDGTLWTQASPSLPLGQNITDLAGFGGDLYANEAATPNNGGGIFSSPDGTTWTQDYTFPGQDSYTEHLQAFDGSLYSDAGSYDGSVDGDPASATIVSSSNGATWSAAAAAGFGDLDNTDISGVAVFDGDLYAATFNSVQGAQVYRTSDGVNWTEVAGDGFGDPDNTIIHQLVVFDDELYAGTENDTRGGEIWRTSDGTDWTLASVPGFGTGKQMRIDSFFTLGGYLYADADNDCLPTVVDFPGCQEGGWELWRLEANPPSCQVSYTSVAVPGGRTAGDSEVVSVNAPGGLASISGLQLRNGLVSWPEFASGTTSSVPVVAVRTVSGLSTAWSFDATDQAGQTTYCG